MAETPLNEFLARSPLPVPEAAGLAAAVAEEVARRVRSVGRAFVLAPDKAVVAQRPDGRPAVRFVGAALPPLKAAPDPKADEEAEREAARVLGALVYRMLTGVVLPVATGTATERAQTPSLGALLPPSAKSGGVKIPDALDGLVMELLAPDPSHRPKLADASARMQAIARQVGAAPVSRMPTSGSGAVPSSPMAATGSSGRASRPMPLPATSPARSSGKTLPPPLPAAKRVTAPMPVEEETSVEGGLTMDGSPLIMEATGVEAAPLPPPPVAPSAEQVPAAPILPPAAATPIVVESEKPRAKRPTDTQAERFFAEGERMAKEMRHEAALAAGVTNDTGGNPIVVDVDESATIISMGAPDRERRRKAFFIAGGAGAVVLILLLFMLFRGGKKDSHASGAAPDAAPDTWSKTPVAAGSPVPAPETTPPPPAPDPAPAATPPDAAPVVAAVEPTPAPAPPPAPTPRTRTSTGTGAKSSTPKATPPRTATVTTPPPPAVKPTPKPAVSSAPSLGPAPLPKGWGSEWLTRARDFRARKKYGDAYNAYFQASSKGDKAVGAAGQLGMAEMAYAQRKYADAISKAKTALKRGASSRHAWRVIALSACATGDKATANSAYAKSGGGTCR